jgi:nucleoside-diphosphate-sugar epimerase
MTTCLVTGGAGFIGSHLTDALVERGHRVRVLDDFSTGRQTNLAHLLPKHIELIAGDLTDAKVLHAALRDVELVFHQAALPSVLRSVEDPLSTHRVCATGTLELLAASRQAGVRRVIYAASSSAYGNSERLPKSESDPTNPLSPYAVAKLAGEHYCASFSHVHGLETVRLRYFNVFGPRQNPDSPYAAVIPRFIRACLAGQSPVIHGDGQQSRDFTFIDDVVQANLLAASAPGVSGKLYNIACGRRTTLLELVSQINALLGTDVRPTHTEPRPGDVRHSQADIQRAQADLGYQARVDVREGLRRCIAFYKADGR